MFRRLRHFNPKILVFALISIVYTQPVYATTTSQSLGDWATSYALQGTTEVFYSAPWIASIVQWCISWSCIIAFIAYYFSYLSSIVVLSNKELFYTIDALKKDKDGNGEGKTGMFGSIISTFKKGSVASGLNGGADNIVVLFLMMFPNFLAYSMYKNIEAGSEAPTGKGSKLSYSDSVMNFILSTSFTSIFVTFILSIALSGLLLRCWFTVGDVLIVKADRFAQTNLVAMLDEIVGNDGAYTFSLSGGMYKGGELAESVARKIYANIIAQFPEISKDQLNIIGKAVEDAVYNDTGVATGAATSILGGDKTGYDTIYDLVRVNLSDANDLTREGLANEEAMRSVSIANFDVNVNDNTVNDSQIVFSIDGILRNAGVTPPKGNTNLYAHVTFRYNSETSNNYLQPTE